MQVSAQNLTDNQNDWSDFVNTNLFCFARLSSDHKILEFNQTAIDFLNEVKAVHGGQSPEDFLGKPVTEFYKAELAEKVMNLLQSGQLPFELQISAGEKQVVAKTYFYSRSGTGEKTPCLMWRSVNKDLEREQKEKEKTDSLVQVITSVQETVAEIEKQIEVLKQTFVAADENLTEFDKICSKTRILSINAAIEAARINEQVDTGVTVISNNMQDISTNIIDSVAGIRDCINTLHEPSGEVISCCQDLSKICNSIEMSSFNNDEEKRIKIVDLR